MSAEVAEEKTFRLEEATIEEMHRAIQAGETTVVEIVLHYIARVRAYNGTSSALVTESRQAQRWCRRQLA